MLHWICPNMKIQVINQIFNVLVMNVNRNTLNNCAYLNVVMHVIINMHS